MRSGELGVAFYCHLLPAQRSRLVSSRRLPAGRATEKEKWLRLTTGVQIEPEVPWFNLLSESGEFF